MFKLLTNAIFLKGIISLGALGAPVYLYEMYMKRQAVIDAQLATVKASGEKALYESMLRLSAQAPAPIPGPVPIIVNNTASSGLDYNTLMVATTLVLVTRIAIFIIFYGGSGGDSIVLKGIKESIPEMHKDFYELNLEQSLQLSNRVVDTSQAQTKLILNRISEIETAVKINTTQLDQILIHVAPESSGEILNIAGPVTAQQNLFDSTPPVLELA